MISSNLNLMKGLWAPSLTRMNIEIMDSCFYKYMNDIVIERGKSEFEIFALNFQKYDTEHIRKLMVNGLTTSKSSKISQQNYEIGQDLYSSGENYKEALEYFYLSLQFAPYDSKEYALALAERSKVHFSLGNHKECLMDIDNALKSTFPREQNYKLYIRQAESLCYLKQNKKCLEACKNASMNLKMFKFSIGKTQYDISSNLIEGIIKKNKPCKTTANVTQVQYPIPELKNGENPKFLNASNIVELKYNERKGRHVIAKKNIQQGDILFMEEPYSTVINDNFANSMRYCSNCFVYTESSIPCQCCIFHFYCSEECKQTRWNTEHKWLCYGEINGLLGDAMRLTLKTILKASFNNFKTNVENESVYGNKGDNYAFIYKFETNKKKMHNSEIAEFTKLSIWLVKYLKECTDFFEWFHKKSANVNKSLSQLYDITGGHVLKLLMQIHSNSNDITDTTIDLKTQTLTIKHIGFGLYPSSVMMNHSCVANTRITFDKSVKIIRAIQKIPKNAEVTVNYISSYNDDIDNLFLQKNYKFKCNCQKCAQPLKNEKEPWLCNKCNGKAFDISATQAKCIDCQKVMNIEKYKSLKESLEPLYKSNCLSTIENINRKMKKIYHQDNVQFGIYFNLASNFYSEEANFSKIMEISKSLVQLCDKYNDVDEFKLHSYLKSLRTAGMNYYFMNIKLLPYDKKAYVEFKAIEKKCLELLPYFVTNKQIKCYKKYIHDFFDDSASY